MAEKEVNQASHQDNPVDTSIGGDQPSPTHSPNAPPIPASGQQYPVPPTRMPMGVNQPYPPQMPRGVNQPYPPQMPRGVNQPYPPQMPMGINQPYPPPSPETMQGISRYPYPPQPGMVQGNPMGGQMYPSQGGPRYPPPVMHGDVPGPYSPPPPGSGPPGSGPPGSGPPGSGHPTSPQGGFTPGGGYPPPPPPGGAYNAQGGQKTTHDHTRKLLVAEETEFGNEPGELDGLAVLITIFSLMLVVVTFPFSLLFCLQVVTEFERAVIFRLGRVLPGAKGPGMFFIIPCIETFVKVDIRTLTFDVPPQEILTKDSVTITVDAVVYYRIFKPMTSVIKVQNAYISTLLLAQTTLRNIIGTMHLQDALTNREQVSSELEKILDVGTDPWGVKVERVEIKDVRLPLQLQRALAKEAEATREAQAKLINAEGEKKAARALSEAAQVMNENSTTLQLRYFQELTGIAAEQNSSIYFPLPLESLGQLGAD